MIHYCNISLANPDWLIDTLIKRLHTPWSSLRNLEEVIWWSGKPADGAAPILVNMEMLLKDPEPSDSRNPRDHWENHTWEGLPKLLKLSWEIRCFWNKCSFLVIVFVYLPLFPHITARENQTSLFGFHLCFLFQSRLPRSQFSTFRVLIKECDTDLLLRRFK